VTDAELRNIFRGLGRDLNDRQKKQLARLRVAERSLFDALMEELSAVLTVENGRINSRLSESGINRAVNKAISQVQSGPMREVQMQVLKDIRALLTGNSDYYGIIYGLEGRKGFGQVKQKTTDQTFKRLGVKDGKLVKGGYLDKYFSRGTLDSEVRSVIASAISGRRTMNELRRQLEITVKGTKSIDGALTREYSELIVDTYHQVDRSASGSYGAALNFKWATYEGGLIETSRKFCIKRDGKVFNTVEAEKWREDPDLPKTTKERQSGVVVNYTPLANASNAAGATATSMGRWRCRHRVRWISEQMAKRLAPERFN